MHLAARHYLGLSITSIVLWAGCSNVRAVLNEPRPETSAEGTRRPLQIGKLIKKRQIAPVTGVEMADWLNRPQREAEEQPNRVIEALRIPEGGTVVDLGAGTGYFTWRLARQVGSTGRVIAVDIQQGMLDRLESNIRNRGFQNVQIVLSEPGDPRIPAGSADLVLLVDVYHELAQPEAIMEHVRRGAQTEWPRGRHRIPQGGPDDPPAARTEDDGPRSAFRVGAARLSIRRVDGLRADSAHHRVQRRPVGRAARFGSRPG